MPSNDKRLYALRLSIGAASTLPTTNSFFNKRPIVKTPGSDEGEPPIYYEEADDLSLLSALWRHNPSAVRLVKHVSEGTAYPVNPATLDQYPLDSTLPVEATHIVAILNPPFSGREIYDLMERVRETIKEIKANPNNTEEQINQAVEGKSYNPDFDVIDSDYVLMTHDEVREYIKPAD